MADLLNVRGLSALQAVFARIPREVSAKALRKGPSAGAAFLKERIRTAAPIGQKARRRGRGVVVPPGTLRRSIIAVYKREDSNENQQVFKVTARQGRAAQSKKTKAGGMSANRDAFYAAWVERGHKIVPRFRGSYTDFRLYGRKRRTFLAVRRRSATGFVKPHPFFNPTVNANALATAEAMTNALQAETQKIVGAL